MPEPLQDHQPILQQIALTDTLPKDVVWHDIRKEIKDALAKNITFFMGLPPPPPPPSFATPQAMPSGVKFPPFPPRINDPQHAQRLPPSQLTLEEATEFQRSLESLLDEFDHPPFTTQRICELCLFPQSHYKSLGKYLRAFERSLLVTGTWEDYQFPDPPSSNNIPVDSIARNAISFGAGSSTPATPLFSPIPFLHQDARNSRSPSPPPSPLALSGRNPEPLDVKPLGLVDELDDPGPGHMSDHPTALTSVTTVTADVQSLDNRFVHGTGDDAAQTEETADEDKENKGSS